MTHINTVLLEATVSKYMRNRTMTLEEAYGFFFKMGIIDTGELAEQAIAKLGEIKKSAKNTKGQDFSDGSDSKYATVGYYPSNKSAYVTISGLSNKTGTLRLHVFDKKTGKNFYFKIPYKHYKERVETNTNIKFLFNYKDGSPKHPKHGRDWWQFECTIDEWVA